MRMYRTAQTSDNSCLHLRPKYETILLMMSTTVKAPKQPKRDIVLTCRIDGREVSLEELAVELVRCELGRGK